MKPSEHRYFILNKPFNMVSQFISPDKVVLLGNLDFVFPSGTHAIGRLDNHSEGLLILTTNKKVTKLLFQGKTPHVRSYLVRVRHQVSQESLSALRSGLTLPGKGGLDYVTAPCDAEIITEPPNLILSQPLGKEWVPHTWLRMSLTEGKFHQVRKMVNAVNHRCTRLIRTSIENIELGDLEPGCVREMKEQDFFEQLNIDDWK